MITNANIVNVLDAASKGQCDAPDEAVAAYRALGRFREARRSAGIGIATARTATELPVTKLLEDLGAGAALTPDYWQGMYDELLAAEKQKTIAQLLDAAEGQAQRIVTSTVESHVGDVIESLTPRLDALVEEVAPVVAQLGDVARVESAVVRSPDSKVRQAWISLDDYGARYAAIRSLWTTLLSLHGGVLGPPLQTFGVIKNVPKHWPEWTTTGTEAVPWPREPGRLILWAIDHEATLWLPTPGQLDQALRDAAAARRDERFADITTGGSS